MANSGGVPSSIAFDSAGLLHICDVSQQAIRCVLAASHANDDPQCCLAILDDRLGCVCVSVTYSNGQVSEFVREYESKPFKGPNTMVMDRAGNIYFSDSGPFGETTIQNPRGSVYVITCEGNEAQLLQPMALECLANPTGITLSHDESTVLRVCFSACFSQARVGTPETCLFRHPCCTDTCRRPT